MPKQCNHTDCNNNVWGKGFCKYHQHIRTDKTNKPLKRTVVKPISDKQKKRLTLYAKAREIYMSENKTCEFGNCMSPAGEIHHIKGRGIQTANPEHFMSICRHHHTHIHNNPIESRSLGYLI